MTLPSEFEIKQGDTRPSMVITASQADGSPVDFTGVTDISLWMRRVGEASDMVVGGSAVDVMDATNGILSYGWSPEDTKRSGSFEAEIRVVWPDGERFTLPADGYIAVTILDDIEYTLADAVGLRFADLTLPAQAVVNNVKLRLGLLFDSYEGGPHIQDETDVFNDDYYALALTNAIYLINGKGAVKKQYDVVSFPFGQPWGDGAASTALLITVIKDFVIAYTEVAPADGMQGPYLNRDDYSQRWERVLDRLDKDLDGQIMALDRQLLETGVSSLIWTNQQPFGIQQRVRPLRPPWYRLHSGFAPRSEYEVLVREEEWVDEVML